MKSGYVISKEQMENFVNGACMNDMYGVEVYVSLDRDRAQALLPPPLKVSDLSMGYISVYSIRRPEGFASWYTEGGLGVIAEYNGKSGVFFMGLMLSGHGALMGVFTGREGSGLPKKPCERIYVERLDDWGHCFIERKGVRLVDIEVEMGAYNDPFMNQMLAGREAASVNNPIINNGGCMQFRYQLNKDGRKLSDLGMFFYDSPTKYYRWEPATAKVTLNSSMNDPWGDLPVTGVMGAGWMVCDNWVTGLTKLHDYPDSECTDIMRYLFSGRFDRSLLCKEHQIYE